MSEESKFFNQSKIRFTIDYENIKGGDINNFWIKFFAQYEKLKLTQKRVK